ncbi:MAG: hypothetical protein LUD19_01845 [Clostridia bacterium]|nr:hypothetical protein [Clostridia bacterium]
MKKLNFVLLTAAAAATLACAAGCTNEQTGGGDTNAEKSGYELQSRTPASDNPSAADEFEFMPPETPFVNEPMPLPLPPQGRIFSYGGRHNVMPDAPTGGSAEEAPVQDNMPKGKIHHKKNGNKGDMLTPDSAVMPRSGEKTETETKEDTAPDEKIKDDTTNKKPDRNGNKRRRNKKQPNATQNNNG